MADRLIDRHRRVFPAWLDTYYDDPVVIERGEGCWVWDADGRRYLDFFGGILTTMTGHAVPEVVAAIQEQAAKVLHTSTLYLSEPVVALAERIADLSGIPDARVFFTTSGTEANDAALLLATSLRRSNQVLALRNSYHGRSFSTIATTGNRSWSPTSLSGLAVHFVHGGYRLRSPWRDLPDDAFVAACVADLRDVIDTATSGDVACLIAEPIQGVGGFATPPDGLLGAMAEVLAEHGILLVCDEVQTGWGRTGEHFWGYEAHGTVPDVLTFAKGVANGVALAGVVAGPEVMDCLGARSISTFGGNPLAAAAALANLDVLLRDDLQGNALRVGGRLRSGLEAVVARSEGLAEVRGKGLMLGLELVRPGGLEPDPAAASAVLEAARRRGLLVGKGGLHGNVLRLSPPMSISAAEADDGLGRLTEALDEVARA